MLVSLSPGEAQTWDQFTLLFNIYPTPGVATRNYIVTLGDDNGDKLQLYLVKQSSDYLLIFNINGRFKTATVRLKTAFVVVVVVDFL